MPHPVTNRYHNLILTATDEALSTLADLGYDAEFGARPLKRVIQHKVEDPLSDKLLSGEFQNGDSIQVTLDPDGDLILERENEREVQKAPAV